MGPCAVPLAREAILIEGKILGTSADPPWAVVTRNEKTQGFTATVVLARVSCLQIGLAQWMVNLRRK